MTAGNPIAAFEPGEGVGASDWIRIDQEMISRFGELTLDPDPMHVDPSFAAQGPFGRPISFGFLTMSLLTHMLRQAMGEADYAAGGRGGHYLNYGFDRLRFVSPVKVGKRVRGVFHVIERGQDEKGRWQATFGCTIEIEGEERPALVGEWLSLWVPTEGD